VSRVGRPGWGRESYGPIGVENGVNPYVLLRNSTTVSASACRYSNERALLGGEPFPNQFDRGRRVEKVVGRTKIFVIDGHPFYRSGVIAWINQQPQLVACGEAESIRSARPAIKHEAPDLVLLDVRLKDGNGIDFTGELVQEHPCIRILVVSHCEEEHFAHRVLKAGARGYVMKSASSDEFRTAIETIMRGQVFVSRRMAARLLLNLFPDPNSPHPTLAQLSDRELQVFQLLGSGSKASDISKILKISPKTVNTYRDNLKKKMRLEDANALAQLAHRWVDTGELSPNPALVQSPR
jgi:DNA-binding NarL/FixJ family response regulator